MVESLREIHTIGYVHRNVRPQNFMIKGGCVKLINFSSACEFIKAGNHVA